VSGFEPRAVATLALAARCSSLSAISQIFVSMVEWDGLDGSHAMVVAI